jgi:Putative restriction endonuclease
MTAPVRKPPLSSIPPLQDGERLTREEFERRYEAMPELKKAELIEGVVYMPSPVRVDQHGSPHADLITWLGLYRANTPGIRVGADTSIRLDLDNEPQPDALMIIEPSYGGQARIDDEGYLVGGPELVAEIAASSVRIDLTTKLRLYGRNNVREYLIWRVEDRTIDWFVLRGAQYEPLQRTPDGLLQSEQFPGLWLDPDALVRSDLSQVLQTVQQGIASAEHASFVAQLQQTARQRP